MGGRRARAPLAEPPPSQSRLSALPEPSRSRPVGAHPLAEQLRTAAARLLPAEGAAGLSATLRAMSLLPVGRLPLLDAVGEGVAALPAMEPKLLADMLDALARLRYDSTPVLAAAERLVGVALDHAVPPRGALQDAPPPPALSTTRPPTAPQAVHEAQAATALEALATLSPSAHYASPLVVGLLPRLLGRAGAAAVLLPHSAAALLHGLAAVRAVPPPEARGAARRARHVFAGTPPDASPTRVHRRATE